THVAPGSTCARYIAAPRPVDRPHAKRQARSNGASGLTFASAISGMTVYSANVEVPMKWRIGSPFRDSRAVPSGRKPRFCWPRLGEVDLLHLERVRELLQHGGPDLHARLARIGRLYGSAVVGDAVGVAARSLRPGLSLIGLVAGLGVAIDLALLAELLSLLAA